LIIGERKPISEILDMIADFEKIFVVGCNSCVAICLAGGEKEVGLLASAIRLARKKEGKQVEIVEGIVERQCEVEFLQEVKEQIEAADLVLSMACGVGVQTIVENFPNKIVYPALNTSFMGEPREQGIWVELCAGCGNCILDKTGGICPIARCAKSLLNGPCGGSQDGKCEVDPDIDCAWQLIYDRLKAIGQLYKLEEILPPKDWTTSRDGGPRKIVREDMIL